MLAGPTVLILGAGSSVDFGLPTGPTLASNIRRLLSFGFDDFGRLNNGVDGQFFQLLLNHFGHVSVVREIAKTIERGISSFNSIDDFLSTHSDDERILEIGKMAIVRLIAQAENKSVVKKLFDHDLDQQLRAADSIQNMWIGKFFRILATDVSRNNVEALFQDLTIVSFNYDRCAEAIFYHLMQPAFNIDEKRAIDILESLRIYRPYGGLGPLGLANNPSTAFGADSSGTLAFASRIRVYTEEMEDRPDLVDMRQALTSAKTIISLGFGFHKQNMKLLDISNETARTGKIVYATVYDVPDPALETIQDRLNAALHPQVTPKLAPPHIDCNSFIKDYEMVFAG